MYKTDYINPLNLYHLSSVWTKSLAQFCFQVLSSFREMFSFSFV